MVGLFLLLLLFCVLALLSSLLKLFNYSDTVLCRAVRDEWWVYLHISVYVHVLLKPLRQVRYIRCTESVEFTRDEYEDDLRPCSLGFISPRRSLHSTSLHCAPGVKVTWWMTGQSDRLSNAARHRRPWDSAGGRISSRPGQTDIEIKKIWSVKLNNR